MKISIRVIGLGTRLGQAARRFSQAARRRTSVRVAAGTSRNRLIQSNEARNAISQPGVTSRDPRSFER
jgi:hypothetical protein